MSWVNPQSPVKVIAIAGGSGSGKTTLAKHILRFLGASHATILGQDSYYIDKSKDFDKDGGKINFDHPSMLEFSLMAKHLRYLSEGKSIKVPVYDFVTHRRLDLIEHLDPHPFILVDGTLILSQPELIDSFDYKIFLNVPEDVRFSRRLKRDTVERGRTKEGVRTQFFGQVKPMHDLFVQPSSENADLVLPMNYDIEDVFNAIHTKFEDIEEDLSLQ